MLNPISFISKIFKSSNQNEIDKIQYLLKKVNDFENKFSGLEDGDFPKKTSILKIIRSKVFCLSWILLNFWFTFSELLWSIIVRFILKFGYFFLNKFIVIISDFSEFKI